MTQHRVLRFVLAAAFAAGSVVTVRADEKPADSPRVTGIGGIFFKAKDPKKLREWYREHLGIDAGAYGTNFYWREAEGEGYGRTVWAPFSATTKYFGAGPQQLMINYRVRDLDGLLAKLRAQGVEQVGGVEKTWYGSFAWIVDGEGNKVELWEPDELSPEQFKRFMKTTHQVDHVILAIGNLDEGIKAFEKQTGVKPMFGGKHPGRGTQNALVSLGEGRYVEIVAPQKDAPKEERIAEMRKLKALTPVGFAVSTTDLEATTQILNRAGFETAPPRPGSRVRPDGRTLEWTSSAVTKPKLDGVPFFIQWTAESVHPSRDAPAGCTLESVALGTAAKEPGELLAVLGVNVKVHGEAARPLEFALKCPKGPVTFQAAAEGK